MLETVKNNKKYAVKDLVDFLKHYSKITSTKGDIICSELQFLHIISTKRR